MTAVTREQAVLLDALARGRYDLAVFSREVLGVEPNPAQRRWFSLIGVGENGWEWRLNYVLHVAANQIGKTLGLAIIIIWACYYKIGLPTEDKDRWFVLPYQWFHVAPRQGQAYLTLKDANLLLRGAHPAQRYTCRLPRGTAEEITIETYYKGLSFWNGSIAQFRTTEDKAKSIQGVRANGISMDECAFEDWLVAVVNETLLMRLIATGGPFFGVSTPNGINDWFEFVQTIIDQSGERPVVFESPFLGGSARAGQPLPIWQAPDGHTLLWSTVEDNVGYGFTREQVDRMEADLDESTKEQQLRGAFLEPQDAFFVPSQNVLAMFKADMPESCRPEAGHVYIISWDPSATTDPCAALVLDVTTKPWRGVEFRYWVKPPGDTKLLLEMYGLHALYTSAGARAITVFDETSMGGAMLKQQLVGLSPKRGINLAGPSTKRDLLTNMRAAINGGLVEIPASWQQVRREVLNYRLPDDKIKQDTVAAAMMALHVAAKGFGGSVSAPFRPTARPSGRWS